MTTSVPPKSLVQLALDDDERPRYSKSQLQDYFDRVGLPRKYRESHVFRESSLASSLEHGLPLLHALTRYHTCNVPFENLVLHYSTIKEVTLDPHELYTKIVSNRRGGRCMENNTFFGTVLRSIGFELRNCGGRVSRAMSPYPEVRQNQSATYDGWNHMLNLVRLDNEWYVVDVGMGSMGPNMPYPLRDGYETTSIAPRRIRVQSRAIAESYGKSTNNLWCYDVCHDPTKGLENVWIPTYCFTETEFLPQDYEMMSWFTSTHPRSFFTRYVTSTRMIMDQEHEEIIGNLTLFEGTIRESIGEKREVIRECKTEDARVTALRELFGIELSEEERNGLPEPSRLG